MQPPTIEPCEYKEAIHIDSKEKFAVKIINKNLMKGYEAKILQEIKIMKNISNGHSRILPLIDHFESASNVYLVMPLCRGGDLYERICMVDQFYERDAAYIIAEILHVVKYLHDSGVVHRDLKPENILFADQNLDSLLVADFGLANFSHSDRGLRTTCGTLEYMAPEIQLGMDYGKPIDMWSLGVMSYVTLSGSFPFYDANEALFCQNAIHAKFDFGAAAWQNVSLSAKDFISKLLVADPLERMTADEALEHPWIQSLSTSVSRQPSLPDVKKAFNARTTFKRVVDVVKATNRWADLLDI
ncbi:hypothetical protein HDV03_002577 [Kappamyces sp. JEL0829]|nr:hypothetical protein HDV03_002577 [Kappamyces sp. JEL0829]